MCVHTSTCVCIRAYMCVHISICVHVYVHMSVYVCMCAYVYAYVCPCVYVSVCLKCQVSDRAMSSPSPFEPPLELRKYSFKHQ